MTQKTKIIIIPGWTYSLAKLEPLRQALNSLPERGYQAELLLVPGLTGEPLTRSWRLDDYVAWLEKTLARESEPVILLGHSNGGRIILKFLATSKSASKVSQTILIASAGLLDRHLKARCKRCLSQFIARFGGKVKKNPTLRRLLYKLLREHDYEQASPLLRRTMANLIAIDLRPLLPQIKTPVALIWGDHDRQTPLYLGRELAQSLPTAQLQVITGSGHAPHLTHLNQVVELIDTAVVTQDAAGANRLQSWLSPERKGNCAAV